MYASQNRGAFPTSLDQLATFIPAFSKNAVFTCPLCAGNSRKPPVTVGPIVSSNYVFCPPPKVIRGPVATRTVLAYEPLTNHNGRGIAVVFCDGHCQWLRAADAKAVLKELTSGQTPPPSLK